MARFLRDRGWTVERAQQSDGRPDADVSGKTPNGTQVAIECKDRAALSMRGLAAALEQAEKDRRAQVCLAVVHVPGNGKEGMDIAVMRMAVAEVLVSQYWPGPKFESKADGTMERMPDLPLPRSIDEAVTRGVGKRRYPARRS